MCTRSCVYICACVMNPTPLFPQAPLCTQMRAPLLVHSIPFSFLPDTPFLCISVIPASPFLLTQVLFSKTRSGNLLHSLFCSVTLVYSFVLALLCFQKCIAYIFFFSFSAWSFLRAGNSAGSTWCPTFPQALLSLLTAFSRGAGSAGGYQCPCVLGCEKSGLAVVFPWCLQATKTYPGRFK